MSESLTDRIRYWNNVNRDHVMSAFAGELYDILERAAQLQVEAAQYKSDAMRFESERNTAIDCAEDYKEIIAQMKAEQKAQIEQLRGELATVTTERDELKRKYDRACNYDFLSEALNSGDGVYRP